MILLFYKIIISSLQSIDYSKPEKWVKIIIIQTYFLKNSIYFHLLKKTQPFYEGYYNLISSLLFYYSAIF